MWGSMWGTRKGKGQRIGKRLGYFFFYVCLTAEQYNRLLGICASQKLLDELVDSLSENIEEGREKPYSAEFPNAHFVRLEKYRAFRLKNPDKFSPHLKVVHGAATFEERAKARYQQEIDDWLTKTNKEKT